MLDRHFTEWFPILFYPVERNGRRTVFDTGETARVADPGHVDCDAVTGWFYRHQLRFAVAPQDELGPQLRSIGIDPDSIDPDSIDPDSIDPVVLSHLYSDHAGGLAHVGNATWRVSATDAGGHAGALPCRMPKHADTKLVRYEDDAFGAFERSTRLVPDGEVRIVPTPGHSPSHPSLLVRDGTCWILLAGDVVFDRGRLEAGRALAGTVEDPSAARRSIWAVQRQLREFDTLLATAHDGHRPEEAGSHVHRCTDRIAGGEPMANPASGRAIVSN